MIRPLVLLLAATLVGGCAYQAGSGATKLTMAHLNATAEALGLDATQGSKDARRDIQAGELRIIRYDAPLLRTGDWADYKAPFEKLGIDETSTWMHPKAYCDAYNQAMDVECSRHLGTRYTALRSKILPPPNAIHWVEAQDRLVIQQSGQAATSEGSQPSN